MVVPEQRDRMILAEGRRFAKSPEPHAKAGAQIARRPICLNAYSISSAALPERAQPERQALSHQARALQAAWPVRPGRSRPARAAQG
jgi:hypothetical protein